MPVDNALYDRMADSWWDEAGFLHALAAHIEPGVSSALGTAPVSIASELAKGEP